MRALKSLILFPCALIAVADPAPIEIPAPVPHGAKVHLRLVFKKGVQIEANRLPKRFFKGKLLKGWIAYEELSLEGKRWALAALFPEDEWRKDEVRHHVRWPELESVWLMAALFSGHGQNYDQIQDANPKNPEKLRKGDVWRIPRAMLSAELGGSAKGAFDRSQPEDDLDDEARVAAYRALLSFEEDKEGKVAVYHLRKGEALYSSVVMRYTDRVDPREVNDLR